MLVYHTDPHADGVQGVLNMDLLSPQQDAALLVAFAAEENFHQRCLSRAIFSGQCVDFTRIYRKRYIFIGRKTIAIDLCNVFHSQDLGSHIHLPL